MKALWTAFVLVLGADAFDAVFAGELWSVGSQDGSAAEFALSKGDYTNFLQRFGSPDRAYYIGLSKPESDWPSVLPGPLDQWAGSSSEGRWDQMNTLPIGFVLDTVTATGKCTLHIDFADTHAEKPPKVRVGINGVNHELDLPKGGTDDSLKGSYAKAKPYSAVVEFDASLLRIGYNEISLRSMKGSWCLFDSVRLDAPAGLKLAAPAAAVVRSVKAAPYAVSADRKTPATLLIEVYQHETPGRVSVQVGRGAVRDYPVAAGLQVLEVPVPASATLNTASVRVSSGEHVQDFQVPIKACPRVVAADYVDVFRGTAHSRWMIAPGPWMPFSMVKIAPDNQTQGWCAGYDYGIESIDCFSHIHEWTMAGLGMMPTVGPLRTKPGLDGTGYSSRIDKASERGGIGFYEVLLKDSGIKVELTATTRASLQRYTFPAAADARVLLDFLLPNEYEMHVLKATVRRTGTNELEGTIQTDFPELYYNGDQRFDLHFVMQLSKPFESLGGWQEDRVSTNGDSVEVSGDCGAFINLKTRADEQILIRTGISLVSVANARLNLEQELAKPYDWQFAAVVENQRRT